MQLHVHLHTFRKNLFPLFFSCSVISFFCNEFIKFCFEPNSFSNQIIFFLSYTEHVQIYPFWTFFRISFLKVQLCTGEYFNHNIFNIYLRTFTKIFTARLSILELFPNQIFTARLSILELFPNQIFIGYRFLLRIRFFPNQIIDFYHVYTFQSYQMKSLIYVSKF